LDIAALSIVKSQMQVQEAVGVAVLKKSMDTAKQDYNLVNQLLGKIQTGNDSAVRLSHLGNKLDIYV